MSIEKYELISPPSYSHLYPNCEVIYKRVGLIQDYFLSGLVIITLKKAGRMGIEGLLKLLDPVTIKEHISSFTNQTAAIDIMSWIYKGCYRCAFDHNQNIESNQFLYYILEMLELLSYYGIKPICVFDGRYVGKKDETIEKRKKMKEENKKKGMEFLSQGNEEEARKYLSRCIIIDDRIITVVMNALHTKNIEFMVAPYESDSQISKLVHLGIADFAITEDSDLIVYNVKVVLKLCPDGDCDFIDLSKWTPSDVDTAYLKLFLKMSHINRVETAILAGSDYNSSIKGIGIKKAIKHLSDNKDINGAIKHLRGKQTFTERIPEDYESVVLDSKLIFSFATIYNPFNKGLQFLNPHLLDEIKPEGLDIEDLKKIVGPFYEYDDDVRTGKVNARNLQRREIKKIEFKYVFSTNIYNLTVRESANQKRKELYIEQKKRRQEEMSKIPQNQRDIISLPKSKRHKQTKTSAVEFTEEEKKRLSQRRKADKMQRFAEFKSILNSFAIDESSQSSSSDSESEEKESQKARQVKQSKKDEHVLEKSVGKTSKEEAEEESESCSQSIEEFLQALNPYDNPWSKKV